MNLLKNPGNLSDRIPDIEVKMNISQGFSDRSGWLPDEGTQAPERTPKQPTQGNPYGMHFNS
jgi:hypothetical protein